MWPESAVALNDLLARCPNCGHSLQGHGYRLIAASILTPDHLEDSRKLLEAIRNHDWRMVVTFQSWEGRHANAEVYGLKCPHGGVSVVVISAPFALEEPYTLMHHEIVDDTVAFGALLEGDPWHAL